MTGVSCTIGCPLQPLRPFPAPQPFPDACVALTPPALPSSQSMLNRPTDRVRLLCGLSKCNTDFRAIKRPAMWPHVTHHTTHPVTCPPFFVTPQQHPTLSHPLQPPILPHEASVLLFYQGWFHCHCLRGSGGIHLQLAFGMWLCLCLDCLGLMMALDP